MEWISVKDKPPPKDKPFLAFTEFDGPEKVVWEQKNYINCPSCNCCGQTGCTIIHFEFWMPLPKPPEE